MKLAFRANSEIEVRIRTQHSIFDYELELSSVLLEVHLRCLANNYLNDLRDQFTFVK